MGATNEFILNSLVNSLWMIPVVCAFAAFGAYLLKNSAANYRYTIWIAALVLSVVAPMLSSTQIVKTLPRRFESTVLRSSTSVPTNYQSTPTDDTDSPLDINRIQKRKWQVVDASRERIQLLTIGYALFVFLAVVRLSRLWWRKEKLRKSATHLGLTTQIESVANYCRTLIPVRNVEIARSSMAQVPCTLGVRRPLIVLPDTFCRYIDDDVLLSVVSHEIAHVSRRDYLTKLLVELLSLPVSFHPITFLIKRQIDRERELACDELVTKRVLMPQTYARSLLSAADLSLLPAPQAIMLSIFDGRILEKRIMKLTKNSVRTSRLVARIILTTVLVVLCTSAVSLSVFGVELRTKVATDLLPTAEPPTPQIASITTAGPAQQPERKLNAPDPNERARAACDAGRKRDLEAIPMLIGMLGDETKTEPLNCWDSGRWNPALQTFKAPSPGEEAAIALASMGRPAFLPLQNQLDSANAVVRRNAAWAIGELTNMMPDERASAAPQLISLLGDRDEWIRMAAARAIGELRDERATETLITTLSDSDWRVRQMVAWALSEMKAQRAVNALCVVLLSDVRAEVRRGAAEALGEIRSKKALASLKQALNDSDLSVTVKVKWAIEEIEDSDG